MGGIYVKTVKSITKNSMPHTNAAKGGSVKCQRTALSSLLYPDSLTQKGWNCF